MLNDANSWKPPEARTWPSLSLTRRFHSHRDVGGPNARGAGFQTCSLADFLIGSASKTKDRPRAWKSAAPRGGAACGLAALIAFSLLAGQAGWAQPQSTPVVQASGFTHSGYHPEPNHTRMKFQITGAQAQPETGNRFRLTQVQLKTFRVNGEPEMAITAPDCVYDTVKRTASSPGHLKVQTGDDRFSVEGEGFLW